MAILHRAQACRQFLADFDAGAIRDVDARSHDAAPAAKSKNAVAARIRIDAKDGRTFAIREFERIAFHGARAAIEGVEDMHQLRVAAEIDDRDFELGHPEAG